MIRVKSAPEYMSTAEVNAYVNYMRKQYPEITHGTLEIVPVGVDVELTLTPDAVKFQRIRRITGYLVGTLDRFNNAKRAEVEDRVKHIGV